MFFLGKVGRVTTFRGVYFRGLRSFSLAHTCRERERGGTSVGAERRRGEGNSFSFSFFRLWKKPRWRKIIALRQIFTTFEKRFPQPIFAKTRSRTLARTFAAKNPLTKCLLYVMIFTENTFSIATSRQKSGQFPRGQKKAHFVFGGCSRQK